MLSAKQPLAKLETSGAEQVWRVTRRPDQRVEASNRDVAGLLTGYKEPESAGLPMGNHCLWEAHCTVYGSLLS